MDAETDRLQRRSAGDERAIGLAGGLPADSTFPYQALSRAFEHTLERSGAEALQYGWPEGRLGLRRFIAAWLAARGASVTAEDVIVTSGAQQAIAIACHVLCEPGDAVRVDDVTYPGALDLFRTAELGPTAAEEVKTRIAYAMPAVGNPRGVALSAESRKALVTSGVPILEDDAYADLRFDGPAGEPLLARHRDLVWHVGTFSKSICPGFRVGWLIPPPAARERALRVKHASDLQANSVAQAILETYLEEEDFEARLVAIRKVYASRATVLAQAIRRHLPQARFIAPEGGFAIWCELDLMGDERELLRVAIAHGTSFDPGRDFRPEPDSTAPIAFRLSFSSPEEPELEEGVRRLAAALEDFQTSHGP